MNDTIHLTRRRLLALGGTASVSVLAGCSVGSIPNTTPSRPVVVGTGFEGANLLVELAENHRVTAINLIGPDGRLFAETSVAEGQTMARLRILDIKPRGAGFKHYTPGTHDLVTVADGGEETMSIELRPDLRIVDVRQYREGDEPNDFGKLVVEVENVGSGPTWVYSVTYRNSPNPVADDEFGGDPGILQLDFPVDPAMAIIHSGASREFVGIASPLIRRDNQNQTCSGTGQQSIFIESPVLEPIERPIQIEFYGSIKAVGLTGEYVCSEVAIKENTE